MALITDTRVRGHANAQPFRDWHCRQYSDCLDQAARVNGSLTCDGCSKFEPREHLDLYDIEMESRLLFAVFYPKVWGNCNQGARRKSSS